MQVARGDLKTGFFPRFPHGAFKGRFTQGGFKFAPDGAPHTEIRGFGPKKKEMLSGLIFEEDEDGDFVIEGNGHGNWQ